MDFGLLKEIRELIIEQTDFFGIWQGTVTCPKCESDVKYSRAQCNGHVHAHCTGGCIQWME